MLGKLSVAPLLTAEPAACRSFSSLDFSDSPPNFASKQNWTCRVRPCVQTNMTRRRCYSWKLHSTDQTQSAVLLEGEEKTTWEECKQSVSALNFTTEEANLMLRKAFGWVHSPYWGEERRKEVPKNEVVTRMLDYLKNLGLSDDDLHKLLKKFPEVLGCNLDDEVKANIGTLEREWGIKGKTLRSLLLRNPKVLGYYVDCKGDCIAKCTRCWVRF